MYRGTTPTHRFTIPFECSLLKEIRIYYKQGDEVILVKETPVCKCEDCTITVDLTQEETFLFNCTKNVSIQLRVLTKQGQSLITKPKVVDVGECFSEEVLK